MSVAFHLTAALVCASVVGSSALAACTPPSPPDPALRPVKPVAPVKGPCVDKQPGTPGCLGWEGYRFNDEVKAYNEKAAAFGKAAQAYVDGLNAYVKASGAYAQCEANELR